MRGHAGARRIRRLGFQVAIPIQILDKAGRPLDPDLRQLWVEKALRELHACFGGSTESPAPGTNMVDGRILYEKGQTLVWSLCRNRDDFFVKRGKIFAFADRMAAALHQHSVLVVGVRADSFLIEYE